MAKDVLYLITCLLIALGGYGACFYFAKRDAFGYALAAFVIGSSTLTLASKVVFDTPASQSTPTTTN